MGDNFVVVEGSLYSLYTRNKSPRASWCVRIQHQGTRRSQSTGTPDIDQAKERAVKIIKAALAGGWGAFEKLRAGDRRPPVTWPTFKQVFKAAKTLPAVSAPLYVDCCRRLVTEALDTKDIDDLTIEVLTAPLVRSFQALRQGFKTAKPARATPANATANQVVSSARSLFSRQAIAHYERAGLSIPDLQSFMEVPLLLQERPRYSDNVISNATLAEIDQALLTASEQVRRTMIEIRLNGTAIDKVPANDRTALNRFLSKWHLSPIDIRHHAGAAMFMRTASVESTAEFLGITRASAEWHFGHMPAKIKPLTVAETYL